MSISGPAGRRDWNRFRSLFLPQARFTEVSKGPDGSKFVLSWNVDEFIRDAGEVFAKDPFYEKGDGQSAAELTAISHKFSAATNRSAVPETSRSSAASNAFQVLNDGKRWWIVSIFWDTERPDNPLPAGFDKKVGSEKRCSRYC